MVAWVASRYIATYSYSRALQLRDVQKHTYPSWEETSSSRSSQSSCRPWSWPAVHPVVGCIERSQREEIAFETTVDTCFELIPVSSTSIESMLSLMQKRLSLSMSIKKSVLHTAPIQFQLSRETHVRCFFTTVLFATVAVAVGLSASARADDIRIIVHDLAPMIMPDGAGREAEVIKNVLDRCGHSVAFEFAPFGRHWQVYEDGRGDAVVTVPREMTLPGTPTRSYVQYHNGASLLAGNAAEVTNLGSLTGRSVITFMGGRTILPGVDAAVSNFSSFKEIADQHRHSMMIFAGRVDAILGDGMIFAAYNEQLRAAGKDRGFDPHQPVIFKAIFDPTSYRMNFRSPVHAADFDRCFAEAEAAGDISRINSAWVERYRDTLGNQYLGL